MSTPSILTAAVAHATDAPVPVQAGDSTGPKWRPITAMYCFLLLITCLTVAIEGRSRLVAREAHFVQSRAATENVAKAAAEQAAATFGMVNALLDGMVERIETDGVDRAARAGQHRTLASRLVYHPALQSLIVHDKAGQCVVSSGGESDLNLNGENADYFLYHRTHQSKRTYVGATAIGPRSNEGVITMSRRLNDAHGQFAGVVVATIPESYFQRYYMQFSLGQKGAVFMAMADGIQVARFPRSAPGAGADMRQTPVFRFIQGSKAEAGTAMLIHAGDAAEGQHSFRRVRGFPLVVGAAMAKDDMLADWWRATRQECMIVGAMLVVINAFGFWLIAQLRSGQRLQSALLAAQRALEHHNLELDRQAHTDALTELRNRRHLDEQLAIELARAMRSRTPVALIMLDVDHFKRYNDEYGHAAGDDCLRMIGAALRQTVSRAGDVVARFGGEEFAVLLPDTTLEGARRVAEALRAAIVAQQLPHRCNPGAVVTISLGVAALVPDHAGAGRTLIETADGGLYAAKAAGRNCVGCVQAVDDPGLQIDTSLTASPTAFPDFS